jgi:hypothetical protein
MPNHFHLLLRTGLVPISCVKRPGGIYRKNTNPILWAHQTGPPPLTYGEHAMRTRTTRAAILILLLIFVLGGCSSTYVAKPMPFKTPSAYPNATAVADATVAAEAFPNAEKAKEAFGFDIRSAGMLPVQIIFDNQGPHPLEINVGQTFLEDEAGNIWPILDRETAYERATKFTQTKQIFQEGAYGAFLGTAAGAIIGAAVGIVTGHDVLKTVGQGAAVGAAAGASLGGAKGYVSDDARQVVINDLKRKTLHNKPVDPRSLSFGFLFFPGEAPSAKELRLQLKETDTGEVHLLKMKL